MWLDFYLKTVFIMEKQQEMFEYCSKSGEINISK